MKYTDQQNGKLIIALAHTMKHIHQKSECMFYQYRLTMAQFSVLEVLRHKGAMSIKEITQAVLSTNGNMTVVIRNLEKRKLIRRESSKKDQRSFLIQLSETGRNIIDEVYNRHMSLVEEALLPLTSVEKEQMLLLMNKLKKKDEV